MPKQAMTSCELFSERGDPWITERERKAIYHHSSRGNSAFDNPDLDRWTQAGKANNKLNKKKVSLFGKAAAPVARNKEQRIARNQQILNKMYLKLKQLEKRPIKVK